MIFIPERLTVNNTKLYYYI